MQRVTIENRDDAVTVITMNRPERRNAIDKLTAVELQQAFAEFDRSPTQRVAVLTGAGPSFSAGADVADLPELWRCIPTLGITTEKPIIAAVNGWCIGGSLVVAMMCDLLVAAESAKFSYPEAKLGFTGGVISSLAARIPHHLAMEVILLGRVMDAQRAYQVGFANEVVPDGQELESALAMARELATFAPMVLATLKRFVTESVIPQGPSEKMARAHAALDAIRESADTREGIAAFKEKRKPVYTGR